MAGFVAREAVIESEIPTEPGGRSGAGQAGHAAQGQDEAVGKRMAFPVFSQNRRTPYMLKGVTGCRDNSGI